MDLQQQTYRIKQIMKHLVNLNSFFLIKESVTSTDEPKIEPPVAPEKLVSVNPDLDDFRKVNKAIIDSLQQNNLLPKNLEDSTFKLDNPKFLQNISTYLHYQDKKPMLTITRDKKTARLDSFKVNYCVPGSNIEVNLGINYFGLNTKLTNDLKLSLGGTNSLSSKPIIDAKIVIPIRK